jgi:hypothetical protein
MAAPRFRCVTLGYRLLQRGAAECGRVGDCPPRLSALQGPRLELSDGVD